MENPLYRFSTQGYPADQRFEVWRDEVNAIFEVNIAKSASPAFNYQLTTCYLGAFLMGCGTWEGAESPVPYGVQRSGQMIRRDGLDHYYICLGLSHSINGTAGRAPLATSHSQIYVLDLARELDSVITAGDTIILTVPRDVLAPHIGNKDIHGLVLNGGLSGLLADHMRALRARSANFNVAEIPYIQQATLAMLAAAITPCLTNLKSAETEIDRSLLLRARKLIAEHLERPDLTPAFLCKALGVSRACLYRLFEKESGVAAYIQARRLDTIRAILQEHGGVHHRVSKLAFQFGFKSESHFSRSFKKAFGYSPRDARDYVVMPLPSDNARPVALHTGFSLRTVINKMALE